MRVPELTERTIIAKLENERDALRKRVGELEVDVARLEKAVVYYSFSVERTPPIPYG